MCQVWATTIMSVMQDETLNSDRLVFLMVTDALSPAVALVPPAAAVIASAIEPAIAAIAAVEAFSS